MYWVNGISKKTISLKNRGLHYGDGFFTTAKLQNSEITFLSWHMRRLVLSARLLMFNNIDFDLLYKEMMHAARYSKNGIIKIIITRKTDGEKYGYYCNCNSESMRIIYTGRLPNCYMQRYKHGVKLKTSVVRLARNSFLSGIKHLNRLEQVMIAKWIDGNKGIDEALVLDTDDNVVECCSANIFWRYDYKVFTPSVYYAGVNGIIRQLVLKLLPKLGYSVQEVIVGSKHLQEADEVFITNSLLPVASVSMIDKYVYTNKILFNLLSDCLIENINYIELNNTV